MTILVAANLLPRSLLYSLLNGFEAGIWVWGRSMGWETRQREKNNVNVDIVLGHFCTSTNCRNSRKSTPYSVPYNFHMVLSL